MSHLLQMRGLKQAAKYCFSPKKSVASFTDAWIETTVWVIGLTIISSHLLQMRGLKPLRPDTHINVSWVASFTDAWIETYFTLNRDALS